MSTTTKKTYKDAIPMITNHLLYGYIWACGDPECACQQPIIEESWYENGTRLAERFWEGTFLSDPSPSECEALQEELAAAAQKHCLEEDRPCAGIYIRELGKDRL